MGYGRVGGEGTRVICLADSFTPVKGSDGIELEGGYVFWLDIDPCENCKYLYCLVVAVHWVSYYLRTPYHW